MFVFPANTPITSTGLFCDTNEFMVPPQDRTTSSACGEKNMCGPCSFKRSVRRVAGPNGIQNYSRVFWAMRGEFQSESARIVIQRKSDRPSQTSQIGALRHQPLP